MRALIYMSPAAQAVLRHIQTIQLSFEQEYPVRALVVAMAMKGLGIRDTVNGIDECILEGWLVRRVATERDVQRVVLSDAGLKKLFLEQAKG